MHDNEIKKIEPAAGPDYMADPDGFAILQLFAREVDCILYGNDAALLDKVHEVQANIRYDAAHGQIPELIGEAVERSDRLTKLVDDWCDALESSAKSRVSKIEALKDKIRLELISHEFALALWFRDRFSPLAG